MGGRWGFEMGWVSLYSGEVVAERRAVEEGSLIR